MHIAFCSKLHVQQFRIGIMFDRIAAFSNCVLAVAVVREERE
jgi:hypothetical protein